VLLPCERAPVDLRMADDEDRDGRAAHESLRNGTEDEAAEEAVTASADDDHRGIALRGNVDELVCRFAEGNVERPLEVTIGEEVEGAFAARGLEVFHSLLDIYLGRAVERAGEPAGGTGIVHEDDGELRTGLFGEISCRDQGGEAAVRAVDADYEGECHRDHLLDTTTCVIHLSLFCIIQLMTTKASPGDALDLIETELAVLTRALERLQRRSEIHKDLDRASYLIARTLETTGPASINGLASALGLDATTVTRQVATMHASRLVVRRADPGDGRVSLIRLSEKGHRTMRAVQLVRRQRIEALLSDWAEKDRLELGRLLGKFNHELSRDPVA
jgi:DNA-binding MarR family transcriptional regulator